MSQLRCVVGLLFLSLGCGAPLACPPDQVSRTVCLECGPADGCVRSGTVCAKLCSAGCASNESCVDGACVQVRCL
ncbi:MAG: hypothetical protein IPJ65_36085 [Archangiaceae bacterium]|nr:hypothetical protein [Archangiaceae bacterium]